MNTRRAGTRAPRLAAAFDRSLSSHLLALRSEIDRSGHRKRSSESLAALREIVARLRTALPRVPARRLGDMAERLDELDYPFEKLEAFFGQKKGCLDRRATEIMAEYLRDRILEIRVMAKALDARQ